MSFYNHSLYQPTYLAVREAVRNFLSEHVFRFDKSRVIVASNDYALRRRYELTDMSDDFNNIKAMSLHLPFCNINPFNTAWEYDESVGARNASLVYEGIYVGTTRMKASRVTQKIPCTFYFDNEPDARLAYDKLHFLSFTKHNTSFNYVYGGTKHIDEDGGVTIKGGEPIALPVVMTITSLKFNPNVNERTWKEQQRMFLITMEIDALSFALFPLNQPKFDGGISSSDYETGADSYMLTDRVILGFGSDFKRSFYIKTRDRFPEEGKDGIYYLAYDEGKFYTWDSSIDDYVENGSNSFLMVTEEDVYDAPWEIRRDYEAHDEYVDLTVTATYKGEFNQDGTPKVGIEDISFYLGTRKELSMDDFVKTTSTDLDGHMVWTYRVKFGVEYPEQGTETDIYEDVYEGGYKIWKDGSWVHSDDAMTTINMLDYESTETSQGFKMLPKHLPYRIAVDSNDRWCYELCDEWGEVDENLSSNLEDLTVQYFSEDYDEAVFTIPTYLVWSKELKRYNTIKRIYVTETNEEIGLADHEVHVVENGGDAYIKTMREPNSTAKVITTRDVRLVPSTGDISVLYKFLVDQDFMFIPSEDPYVAPKFVRVEVKSPCFLTKGETYAGYIQVDFNGDLKEERTRSLVTELHTSPLDTDNRMDDLLEDWTPAVYDKDVLIGDDRVLSNQRLKEEHSIVGIHW